MTSSLNMHKLSINHWANDSNDSGLTGRSLWWMMTMFGPNKIYPLKLPCQTIIPEIYTAICKLLQIYILIIILIYWTWFICSFVCFRPPFVSPSMLATLGCSTFGAMISSNVVATVQGCNGTKEPLGRNSQRTYPQIVVCNLNYN